MSVPGTAGPDAAAAVSVAEGGSGVFDCEHIAAQVTKVMFETIHAQGNDGALVGYEQEKVIAAQLRKRDPAQARFVYALEDCCKGVR